MDYGFWIQGMGRCISQPLDKALKTANSALDVSEFYSAWSWNWRAQEIKSMLGRVQGTKISKQQIYQVRSTVRRGWPMSSWMPELRVISNLKCVNTLKQGSVQNLCWGIGRCQEGVPSRPHLLSVASWTPVGFDCHGHVYTHTQLLVGRWVVPRCSLDPHAQRVGLAEYKGICLNPYSWEALTL